MVKAFIAIVACVALSTPAWAAAPAQPQPASVAPKAAKPDWNELTAAQRGVLAPLREDWSTLDTTRREKWIVIADRFPKMKPHEQKLLQTRMQDWSKLTPEQRRIAREKFTTIKKLPAAKREEVKAQWDQYQQSLAAKAEPAAAEPSGTPATQSQ